MSPDARFLVYVIPPEERIHLPLPDENDLLPHGGTLLRLRDESGNEQTLTSGNLGDFRFSPDSNWLAVLANSELWIFSLRKPFSQKLATYDSPMWLEWNAFGIAVLDRRTADGTSVIDVVDLQGTALAHVALPEHPLTRITTAANTGRIVMFTAPEPHTGQGLILEMSTDSPHVPPSALGKFSDGPVVNAEMAPNGSEFTYATQAHTWLVRGETPRKRIQWVKSAHSIWYTPDGNLVAADADTAVVFHDGRVWSIKARSGAFQTLRVRRDADGFVLVHGNRVKAWNPWTNTTRTLGQVALTRHLVSADSFAGGLVFWTTQKSNSKRKYQSQRYKSLSQNYN
ncbi:MAG: hypothetical protein HUU55_00925 [Myxococcales bacterium]|nr:hypothetical protein [Myxococcales bacterium]